jgi:hypothetical protein
MTPQKAGAHPDIDQRGSIISHSHVGANSFPIPGDAYNPGAFKLFTSYRGHPLAACNEENNALSNLVLLEDNNDMVVQIN